MSNVLNPFQHLPDGHRGHLGAVVDRPIPPYKHIKDPETSSQNVTPTTSRSMPKRAATVDHPPTYDSATSKK